MAFKIGNVVNLKSSRLPKMTVAKLHSSGLVTCQWFNNNDLEEKSFNEETLELYVAPAVKASARLRPTYFKGQKR